MELGTETGSLINGLLTASAGPNLPAVGDPATVTLWTDRHAATVTAITQLPGRTFVEVTEDTAKVVSGGEHDGSAEYEYSPNPDGRRITFQLVGGKWVHVEKNKATNRWRKANSYGVYFGRRDQYRDPHI